MLVLANGTTNGPRQAQRFVNGCKGGPQLIDKLHELIKRPNMLIGLVWTLIFPYGRPYRYHLNRPVYMITARKKVGPLPTHRLAVRHSVDYSSSDHFSLDDSSRDSSSSSSSETSSRDLLR
ncbi:hypothetical protein Tco_0895554 [Tanacetum coccineum]|uniref:Uncharacterized protein n=1 Tax=Tanacetum coccineum TaxID=301880 RepID=A0ABQ5CH47_9ASTR